MIVGKQTQLVNTLKSLVALDFAAIIAYQAAIKRLEDAMYKRALERFLADHWRHTDELAPLIAELGGVVAVQADMKTMLTKGKVLPGSLVGDSGILAAMHANEGDTNTVYEHACLHEGASAHVHDVLRRALQDERRHKAWLECVLGPEQPLAPPSGALAAYDPR